MIPLRLYIINYVCYSNSFIDFTKFRSALIIGRLENSELFSNGVGKTTIFKAIEYVLFNKSDYNLEGIIRDDTASCNVVFDFMVDNQEYRVSRTRTKKGSSDFTLLQRNAVEGDAYHICENEIYKPISDKKYWKEICGRRTGDTEKELEKLIKTDYKSFRNTVHFLQNDFGGLGTVTPKDRKIILREALNLSLYSKLEKIAKEKAGVLSKDIDKNKVLIDNLGNPEKDLLSLNEQLITSNNLLVSQKEKLDSINLELETNNSQLNNLINKHSILENTFSSLLQKEKTIKNDIYNIESSIKNYQDKKSNIVKSAKILSEELKNIKDKHSKLNELDFSTIDSITNTINSTKEQITTLNVNIKNVILKCEELKVPLPNDSVCKHCRQPMTVEHRQVCQSQINKELDQCKDIISNSKKEINSLNSNLQQQQLLLNNLNSSKQQLDLIISQISLKNKELQDKKALHDEYQSIITQFMKDLSEKEKELNQVKLELNDSSIDEAKKIQADINNKKNDISKIILQLNSINKEITHLTNTVAIINHNIEQKQKDLSNLKDLQVKLKDLEKRFSIYPTVLKAFSSNGIPNLIIQNILDDLQIEANNLLSQLKPGLQLSFVVEKTKGDGTQDDTLDINYCVNGKNRYYEQLSGAMKLSVMFSLKLGLSFVLHKMTGMDIRFLLLDEIDQSLDKAGIDAFADIIKFFQKDFTILVITHNDRLQDKFDTKILVEQNIDRISSARVIN